MFARSVLTTLLVFAVVTPVFAQGISNADAQYEGLIEERLEFIRDMYSPDTQALNKIKSELNNRVAAHADYMKGKSLTLRRMRKAIKSVIYQQPDLNARRMQQIHQKMQDDIYRINTEAPLSLSNSAAVAEQAITPEQVKNGRIAMAKKFAGKLKGAPLEIGQLDRLLINPVTPDAQPQPLNKPVAPNSGNPNIASVKPTKTPPTVKTVKQTPTPPVIKPNRKPQAPPPPAGKGNQPTRPIVAAPPVNEWSKVIDSAVSRYKFSADQKVNADRVLKSCMQRAQQHLQKSKAEYEAAKSDSEHLKKLNIRLDKLYHELHSRVDALASHEQRASVKSADKPAAPKPATPN